MMVGTLAARVIAMQAFGSAPERPLGTGWKLKKD
jgi:hypothetical protein